MKREDSVPSCCAWLAYILLMIVIIIVAMTVHFARAEARDAGQWDGTDPATREWYQSLMQPDVPTASCCGEADAYFADDVHVRDGRTFVIITDDREDAPRRRPHIDVGTEMEVPNNKLKWDKGNPTGHGVLFVNRAGYVYCFVQGSGI